jgi:tRNA modification GTPase
MAGYFSFDPVVAIATPPDGFSAIGVIRISGAKSLELAQGAFRLLGKGSIGSMKAGRLYRAAVVDGQGKYLDEGMVVFFRSPNSYTGEDSLEFYLHGNPYTLRACVDAFITLGFRQALAGEFSFRAFRNGKLSLDQAESVSDLIHSQTEESAARALASLSGRNRDRLAAMRHLLIQSLAAVEVDIDFSDQGLSHLDYEGWAQQLERWVCDAEGVRTEFLRSRPVREGVRLALVGAPNSGKSSLFNALLGEDRSIVTATAGTTRDVVRESVRFGDLLVRLADTAGVRSTENEVEKEGIGRSLGEASLANLVLWVVDGAKFKEGSDSLLDELAHWKGRLSAGATLLCVWNKSDLVPAPLAPLAAACQKADVPIFCVSAVSGAGVGGLVSGLRRAAVGEAKEGGIDFALNNRRHFEVMGRSIAFVQQAILRARSAERFPDLLAGDLRSALESFGEISGEFSNEQVLTEIFSSFCIGK